MIQKLKTTYAAKKKQHKQKKIIEEFDAQNAAAIISNMSTIHKANEQLKQNAAPTSSSTSNNVASIDAEKQSFENDDRRTRTYAEIAAENNTNVAAPVSAPAPTAVMETKQHVEEENSKSEKNESENVVHVQEATTQNPVITLQVPVNASTSPGSIGRKVEEAIRATRQSQQGVDHRDVPPSSGTSVPPAAVTNVTSHGYNEYPRPPKEHVPHHVHSHEHGHHYYHKEHVHYPPPPHHHAYKHYPPPPYMHGYPHGPPPPHYHHPHAVPMPVYSSHGPPPPEYYPTYPAQPHPYYAHAPPVYPPPPPSHGHHTAPSRAYAPPHEHHAPPPPPAHERNPQERLRLDLPPHERNSAHRRLHRHPRYPYNETLGYDEQGGNGAKDLFRRIGIYKNEEKTEESTSDAPPESQNDVNTTDDSASEKISEPADKETQPKFKPPSSHSNVSKHVQEEQIKRKALKDKFEDNVSKNAMDVINKKAVPRSNSLDFLSSVVGEGMDDM